MSLIIDLAVIAIILISTFLGYKKGLIKVALNLCTFFIAIILAFIFFKPFSSIVIQKTSIDESIQHVLTPNIKIENLSDATQPDLISNLPVFILKNGENTVQEIAVKISNLIINTGCFLVIFLVAKIILHFVTILADAIAKLPILNQFNKLGGTLYGLLNGIFIVFVGFAVISLIAPLIDAPILSTIQSTTVASILYNNNILLKFIA